MSNYKVGDKLVLEITNVHDECSETNLGFTFMNFALDGLDRLDSDYINEHFGELHDEAYNQGLNDAWELARKIYDKKCEEVEKIFDVEGGFWSVIRDYTPQEALAKLKAYDEAQEIKVGDVVVTKEGDLEYLITFIGPQGCVSGVNIKSGRVIPENFEIHMDEFKKTGKHIDIQSILEQIGE